MATAVNSTVKCYAGVPLMRGGTEVLYLAQGEAEGALSGFLRKAFSHYYYVRETENYIQVDATIGELEGCNYVSFANFSHGGKIFFGFIRALEYVNDNCTGIYFDIDPFPTYLGDCTEELYPYVVRNTPSADSDFYIADDYDFQSKPFSYNLIGNLRLPLAKTMTLFTAGRLVNEEGVVIADTDSLGANSLNLYGFETGIQYKYNMSPANVKLITQAGGHVLGVYAVDSSFTPELGAYDFISCDVQHDVEQWEKLKTGQYNKISVVVSGKAKSYDLNKFTNRSNIQFRVKRLVSPTPTLAVIPLQYEGIPENTAQALLIDYPMLATSVSNYINTQSAFENIYTTVKGLANGAATSEARRIAENFWTPEYSKQNPEKRRLVNVIGHLGGGFSGGGELLANLGAAFAGGLGSMIKGEINTDAGGLVLTDNNQIVINVIQARHSTDDILALNRYFDYFGYAMNQFMVANTLHDAYLQTGSPFLRGSEADVILNQMLERGIKIKKHF